MSGNPLQHHVCCGNEPERRSSVWRRRSSRLSTSRFSSCSRKSPSDAVSSIVFCASADHGGVNCAPDCMTITGKSFVIISRDEKTAEARYVYSGYCVNCFSAHQFASASTGLHKHVGNRQHHCRPMPHHLFADIQPHEKLQTPFETYPKNSAPL